jgi:hypothetical protein
MLAPSLDCSVHVYIVCFKLRSAQYNSIIHRESSPREWPLHGICVCLPRVKRKTELERILKLGKTPFLLNIKVAAQTFRDLKKMFLYHQIIVLSIFL